MEDTANHETVYNLAHRAAKAKLWSDNDSAFGRIVIQLSSDCFVGPLVGFLISRLILPARNTNNAP